MTSAQHRANGPQRAHFSSQRPESEGRDSRSSTYPPIRTWGIVMALMLIGCGPWRFGEVQVEVGHPGDEPLSAHGVTEDALAARPAERRCLCPRSRDVTCIN